MVRYGNPRYASEEHAAFAQYFKNTQALLLLGPVMNTLASKAQVVHRGTSLTAFRHAAAHSLDVVMRRVTDAFASV